MLLRDSAYKGNATFEPIPHIDVEDFADIVAMAGTTEAPKSAALQHIRTKQSHHTLRGGS